MLTVKYGFNIGTSDMKKLLEQNERQANGIQSWKQLFSGASQDYRTANAMATTAFSDAIAQAYKANLTQQDAIASAGLSAGVTREFIESNRQALHSAYQTYVQNYGETLSKNAENYLATKNAYDAELTARAENFSKLYNYAYQYLAEELAGSTYNGNTGGPIANGTNWLTANNLDWLYDAELGKAKSWDSISGELFDRDTAELTDKGREFFDAMFNAQTGNYITSKGEGTRGFDKWLSDTDAELRDWYTQGNVYNSTEAGTNFGTAKQLLGLKSTDQTYMPAAKPLALEGTRVDKLNGNVDHLKYLADEADKWATEMEKYKKAGLNDYYEQAKRSYEYFVEEGDAYLKRTEPLAAEYVQTFKTQWEDMLTRAGRELDAAAYRKLQTETEAIRNTVSDIINKALKDPSQLSKLEKYYEEYYKKYMDLRY